MRQITIETPPFKLTRSDIMLHGLGDEMVGDPFGGTAYGQRNKSGGLGMILGVVASVVTMGAALPMLASATLATQLCGGVMMAGGVLSGVGAITGNKKLTKIGGVLSLAGGVGAMASGMASSAGVGGAFAEGTSSTAVQNMSGTMMESINSTGLDVFKSATIDAAKSAGSMEALKAAGPLGDAPMSSALTDVADIPLATQAPAAGALGDAPMAGGSLVSPTDGAGAIKLAEATGQVKPVVPGSSGGGGLKLAGVDVKPGIQNDFASQTPGIKDVVKPPPVEEKGVLGKFLSFTKENPELTKIAGQGVLGAAQAATGDDKQDQIDALTAAYQGQANILKTQNDVAQYQAANSQKQVAMISADAPDLDAQVKAAAAKGIPVAFIPTMGGGGIKQVAPTAWGSATAAQTPTRNVAPATPTAGV